MPKTNLTFDADVSAVVDLLETRGITATHDAVWEWAEKMVEDYKKHDSGLATKQLLWLRGVLAGHRTATMCLHIHFGDSKR